MGVTVLRILAGGLGVLLIVSAITMVAVTDAATVVPALSLFVPGAVLIAAVLLERTRYRSLHAEQTGDAHGPGGGELAHPDRRFRPTEERFVDPTTGIAMQVWLDPRTGERRYVPLG